MKMDVISPSIGTLTQESLLVQAWKKTASYIRNHNWYADTLELDRTAVDLPHFLSELADQLSSPEEWRSNPIRIVPAPKSQRWVVTEDGRAWMPVDSAVTISKLRPLAHVSIRDQVAATAMMLCLSDRVESLQGDPRDSILTSEQRRRVISYGNRLFCDGEEHELRHRWGSTKLYRAFYQDYRSFLSRSEVIAEAIDESLLRSVNTNKHKVFVVHSDLKQYYDRVTPRLLVEKVQSLMRPGDDPRFFSLIEKVFGWEWDPKDASDVGLYAEHGGLEDFSKVALPQGLVASGFFSNVVLLDFDESLRKGFEKEIAPGIEVHDVCRYVDDLRVVLTVPKKISHSDIESIVTEWLQGLLASNASGLLVSKDKTKAAAFRGDERPLIRQSRKMERIQGAVSGGFDAVGGEEILDSLQGLLRSQQRYSENRTEGQGWLFSPIPDVRDATVARFAAARFRTTYRSLRPLLEVRGECQTVSQHGYLNETDGLSRVRRTQADLDDDARTFALGLIENWVEDPSNVRLLRIGLDLWPAEELLTSVLDLLRPFTESGGPRKGPRRVAWYCLAEIFRAGATETGFVENNESLPVELDISAYRRTLLNEATRLLSLPPQMLPWYLKQQVLLFVAVNCPVDVPFKRVGRSPETVRYRELILFMNAGMVSQNSSDFAIQSILARRSFLKRENAIELVVNNSTPRRLEEIATRDPSFLVEIIDKHPELVAFISPRVRDDLSIESRPASENWHVLSDVVIKGGALNPLRNEKSLLDFACEFINAITQSPTIAVVTPSDVLVRIDEESGRVDSVKIRQSRVSPIKSMYLPPSWCPVEEHWRFQLGSLMRFILTAQADFTRTVRALSWREDVAIYRVPEGHWHQRIYGAFNGYSAFGDDWLPISGWTESMLFTLLRWPGCHSSDSVPIEDGVDAVKAALMERIKKIDNDSPEDMLMLRLPALRPDRTIDRRPLRACIIQTVLPAPSDFPEEGGGGAFDLTFSDPGLRRKHRNHLSTALAAIERMLDLRETHKGRDGRLDWLILPELSVHPDDVKTHLLPFARAHKTIILAGLTYEELFSGKPLINSALWIIPQWTTAYGLQIITRRQGKLHLSPEEEKFNRHSPVLAGFRPSQWLIGYDWSKHTEDLPLWLSAAICYDATDLRLASELRSRSDIFAIPAYNKDVKTFDQMALALHYHMFQLVLVANNGTFGGSNAYTPYREDYRKQLFHLHGQPQASIAFLELEEDEIVAFIRRKENAKTGSSTSKATSKEKISWKYPPAGL